MNWAYKPVFSFVAQGQFSSLSTTLQQRAKGRGRELPVTQVLVVSISRVEKTTLDDTVLQ